MAGGYKYVPQGIQALVAEFRGMKNEIRILRKMITGFGLTVDPQGNLIFGATGKNVIIKNGSGLDIQDDGSANIDGSLAVGGTETVGGTLHVTGNTIIDGTLSLPAGIIGNAALAHPTASGTAFDSASNYSVPFSATPAAGGSAKAAVSLTVPTGFTQAAITAVVQDSGVNSTANTDSIASWVGVLGGTAYSFAAGASAPPGSYGVSFTVLVDTLSGLTSGQVLTIQSRPFTYGATWAASTSNGTILSVNALFLR
jgi:hypothetical protein